MRKVKDNHRFFGTDAFPPTVRIVLNDHEMATLRRAIAIREEVRERLEAAWGTPAFESSDEYTLSIDDLANAGEVSWRDYAGVPIGPTATHDVGGEPWRSDQQ